MSNPIKVVDVRHLRHLNPQPFIYVGRSMPGFKGHALANWRRLPVRHDVVQGTYTEWLEALPNVDEKLQQLLGQVRATGYPLGCWCCDWDGVSVPWPECHAVVLAVRLMKLERANG